MTASPQRQFADVEIAFSRFNNKHDNMPKEESKPWAEVAKMLARFETRENKDCALWSPTKYKPRDEWAFKPDKVTGEPKQTGRSNDNVSLVYALVLDFDKGIKFDEIEPRLKGYEYVAHSTHSHTADYPKWRAVLPFKSPVAANEWEEVYAKIALALGSNDEDKACKDSSRMFYLPAHPEGREAERFAKHNPGKLLDPSEFPAIEREPTPIITRTVKPASERTEEKPWEAWNRAVDPADYLEGKGWRRLHRDGEGWAMERPGQPDKGKPGAFTGRGDGGLVHVFTSSAAPLEPGENYDAFTLYAIYEHGGDKTAAAAALGRLGYGAAPKKPNTVMKPTETDMTCRAGATTEGQEGLASEKIKTFPLTDDGNAQRLVEYFGNEIRFDSKRGFFSWNGCHWEHDSKGRVYELAKRVTREIIYTEAKSVSDEGQEKGLISFALKSQNGQRIKTMVELAKTDPRIAVLTEDFDADDWLINFANCTYDLKTGETWAHRQQDMISRVANVAYDPSAQCPRWERFVKEIACDDIEMVDYLQRICGYTLTGSTSEQCLFLLNGKGANGKTTFLEALQAIMGDYARTVESESLVFSKTPRVRTDIARLVGARLMITSEVQRSRHLDSHLLKKIAGGDKITARELYGKEFEFHFTGKLLWAVNSLPRTDDSGEGMFRRIRRIPFDGYFPLEVRDPELLRKLFDEKSGILNWILEGLRKWKSGGLVIPKRVLEATEEYKLDSDPIADFLAGKCILKISLAIPATELYKAYKEFAEENALEVMTQTRFGTYVNDHGFKKDRKGKDKKVRYLGLALAANHNESLDTVDTVDTINPESSNTREYKEKFPETACQLCPQVPETLSAGHSSSPEKEELVEVKI